MYLSLLHIDPMLLSATIIKIEKVDGKPDASTALGNRLAGTSPQQEAVAGEWRVVFTLQ